MKFKAGGWLFGVAMMGIAAALFVPAAIVEPSLPLLERVKRLNMLPVLAWFLAALAFWGFKARFWRGDHREDRQMINCVLLLVLQAGLLRTVLEVAVVYRPSLAPWMPPAAWAWMPWFLIPGLTGMLLGGRFAVVACLGSALMLYLVGDPGPLPVVGCMTSALVGVLLLRRSPTRGRVLRAGTGAGLVLGVVAAAHYATIGGVHLEGILGAAFTPLVVGFASAFAALAILPVLEWVLGELSDVTLVEYGTDHALLDDLRTNAPGTWNHSLNVADLAEKAAASVGAKALFCKTSALYHDIGKLKDPSLFAENNDGPSPHDTLDPQTSAERIIEHVPHGIELARKYRLPRAFREIIAEHHGISVVRFFYAKACQALPDGSKPEVNRAAFSYPGPPPSTRESGIIALADIVEAASRSLPAKSETDLRSFVRKLLADRISEGELAQCPLTLADLAKIEAAFVGWLKGRNHQRPAYPGQANEPIPSELARPEHRSVPSLA